MMKSIVAMPICVLVIQQSVVLYIKWIIKIVLKLWKPMFESEPDYRKIVFLLFLIKNDFYFLNECSYLKNDFIRLCLEFKKFWWKKIKFSWMISKMKENLILKWKKNKLKF